MQRNLFSRSIKLPKQFNHRIYSANIHQSFNMSSTTGSSASSSSRTYAEAIDKLNSLQSNASVIEHIRKTGGKNGEAQMGETIEYLNRIGYQTSDLNALNALHITGTKGKGSTSAFVDSILRKVQPEATTGLYTSPHMVAVRERIRINGKPIEEVMFAKYFFEVWDRLERNPQRKDPESTPEKPAYFRYLTLMAFHVFLQEKVDATILEVGVGGTYDSTNVVPQPITTGVTSLGIDHVFVLGKTIPEIATQKGGIYKPGVPALAVDQPAEGLDVLRARAKELGASSFNVIPVIDQLDSIKLGLAGVHQRINASLAVALVQSFLASPRLPPAYSSVALSSTSSSPLSSSEPVALPSDLVAPTPLPASIVQGLESTRWPGRCQIETDSVKTSVKWYLDGAHTVESLECCGDWFGQVALSDPSVGTSRSRVLIFNCTSGRSGPSLLGSLIKSLAAGAKVDFQEGGRCVPFHEVIFCTNTTYASGSSAGDLTSNAVDLKELENLTVQNELKSAWETLEEQGSDQARVHVLGSIEEAVRLVRQLGADQKCDVLVSGSLHLVGGVMAVAELPL